MAANQRERRLEQSVEWYRGWMIEDVTVRRKVLESRRDALAARLFDRQTLNELVQILNHEHLCIEYGQPQTLLRNGDVRRNSVETSLQELLGQVVQCLVQVVSGPNHLESLLLLQILLSILALLHHQGSQCLPDSHRSRLLSRFESELQQELRINQPPLTVDHFRVTQISYLLRVALEYDQLLGGMPLPISVITPLRQWIVYAFQALPSESEHRLTAQTTQSFQEIERRLSEFWRQISDRLQVLAAIQELTRLAVALHLLCTVTSGSSRRTSGRPVLPPMLQGVQNFAKVVIGKISDIITDELDLVLSPQSPTLTPMATFAALDITTYLCGTLECSRQLSGILETEDLPQSFRDLMMRTIATTDERRFRWKAIEVLLVNASNHDDCSKAIIAESTRGRRTHVQQQSAQLIRAEVQAISHCILQERGQYVRDRRYSQALSSSGSLVSDEGPKYRIRRGGWNENDIEPVERSSTIETVSVELKRPKQQASRLMRRLASRVVFSSSGLSPSCEVAYLQSEDRVVLYDIRKLSHGTQIQLGLELIRPQSYMKDAVLSNCFLAFTNDHGLEVHDYHLPLYTQQIGKCQLSEQGAGGHRWEPSCIAIHEGRDQVWIAVGGGIVRGVNGFVGDIKLFHFKKHNNGRKLEQKLEKFYRSRPDPLAGGLLKGVQFSPDKSKLVCITNNNVILIWRLSNNGQPKGHPFMIERAYTKSMVSHGVTSATLFFAPSRRPYIFTTTSPSFERAANNGRGEWSYISPVAPCPVDMPPYLEHDITSLQSKYLVGTVTTNGGLVAVLEESGKIKIVKLTSASNGGIDCESFVDEQCSEQLSRREKAGPTSLRFLESPEGLFVFAIDQNGTLVRHKWTDKEIENVLLEVPAPPAELPSIEPIPQMAELPSALPSWELSGISTVSSLTAGSQSVVSYG